jgi:ketosteroid isomerase-like protein
MSRDRPVSWFIRRFLGRQALRDTAQAMSQENVETLRGGFDAFARGDVDDVLERLDTDVDWSPAIGPILGVETVRGREALRRFLTRDLFEGFDQFGAEPLSIEDLGGEYVLVMVRYTGRGQSSGIEMDMTSASLYRMRDGKVVTMRDYPTRTEALEAAGFPE